LVTVVRITGGGWGCKGEERCATGRSLKPRPGLIGPSADKNWEIYYSRCYKIAIPLGCLFMPYEYDAFLSYRRHGEWPQWVRNVFRPLFAHWLGEEHPGVRIFIDYEIETGAAWPHRLGKALGESRVLVPLFSRQYFSSEWCQLELSQMSAREERCNFRTAGNAGGLIIPAHIHDGDGFPARAQAIQAARLQEYTNVRLAKGSPTEERLSEEIRNWVPDIAAAIRSAPPHDNEWTHLAVEAFVAQFRSADSKQTTPPSLG
jgi:hypothetical protein